ncbi:MAG: TIM barrel protein [Candidatus Solibacter usitatus]|nr:TIM barrel protein [Candidatus Solibacter usitatus]
MRRREFLTLPALAAAQDAPTRFQIACMTLPYSAFPLERALSGIREAGYQYVAWGTNHRNSGGRPTPLIAVDAPPAEAASLAARCRGMNLEPVMMFCTVNLEAANALDAHLRRIEQAAAAKIPFLLTFGKTERGAYESVIGNLQSMAAPAKSAGVTVVIKQHGGNTGTGVMCSRIIKDVGHEAVRMCYDAGNVLDYESIDPLPDIRACWRDVRAFAIKDHRKTPKNEDCGPGFGEIDHYKLLAPVMRTGLVMPLACENIFEPLVPRPTSPEGVDALARRAREYLVSVVRGLEISAR